ncbi:chemotaxis protein CheD [Leptospira ryugenii]|uniref:chemotaxis protein CheD n=1 Tax=Leptospira ryugenii TaxID=1917863 RepID=UPI001FCEF764|nr:chemotaxis protein CheD [Leptospira ryugenii]
MDETPRVVKDIYLNPGEFYFGGPNLRLRTLLGSCVSIVLWNPIKKIGGMCHFVLSHRTDSNEAREISGKYGDEAFLLFQKEVKKHNTQLFEYEAKVFGGSHMFLKEEEDIFKRDAVTNMNSVGDKNYIFAKKILEEHSVKIVSESLGGNHHRKIIFTVWDGEVWLDTQRGN